MAYRPNQTQSNPYNPYADIQKIYNYKNNWQQANKNKDQSGMQTATDEAKKYYASLRNNGYSNVADSLANSNYDQSKAIHDYYAMFGKTATRPYLYSKAEAYGKTQADVDKLINWNDATGQITFGGQLIGTPNTISSDGVSYWNDTSALDKAFEAEAKNRGWTIPTGNQYGQAMQSAQDISVKSADTTKGFADAGLEMYRNLGRNRQAQFDYANQNLTGTDEFRGMWNNIMPAYEYESDKAALNAAADAASTNSGNIDSFAAANARRQREASLAKGQQLAAQMGLAAFQTRAGAMDDANNGMRDDVLAGGQAAQNYAGSYDIAASRQNQIANDITDNNSKEAQNKTYDAQAGLYDAQAQEIYSRINGMATNDASHRVNPYFNSDGSVMTSYDYKQMLDADQARLDAEKAKPEAEQDKNLIAQLESNMAYAEEARIAKMGLSEYQQYANDGWTPRYYNGRQYGEYSENAKDRQNALDTINTQGNANIALANAQSANDIAAGRAATDDEIRRNNAATDNIIKQNTAAANDTININKAASANTIAENTSAVNDQIGYYNATGGGTGTGTNSNGQITSLTQPEYNNLISDLNKVRTKDWGYKTGMFDKDKDGNYILNTNKATVESVIDQLISKGYSDTLIASLLKQWGLSDSEIQTGVQNWSEKYATAYIG